MVVWLRALEGLVAVVPRRGSTSPLDLDPAPVLVGGIVGESADDPGRTVTSSSPARRGRAHRYGAWKSIRLFRGEPVCAAPVNNVNLSGGGGGGGGVTRRSLSSSSSSSAAATRRDLELRLWPASLSLPLSPRVRGRRPQAGSTRGDDDDDVDVDVEDEGRLVPENNCKPCYL